MRNIVTISLPEQLDKEIEKEVKSGKFASKSEFIRSLIRLWQEEKIFRELEQGRKEIEAGMGKELKSLKDLR
ncbi:MAG: ribbon-helix-helix domain-containing protein [Candidatus Pacebacteria bacterium]|jgi:putative addiction module CopG family antidote|nr:ribbon-helix-helix domain-containing protein [Candidatus Paceibacterota bacterium]